MKDIEIRLKELRKTKNLSQEELAQNLGVSRQSIISLERGEYLPSLPLIIDLVKFFEIPFEEIIMCEGINDVEGGEEKMPREITPWSPLRDISTLHDAIDRMFEESFTPRMPVVPSISIPVINVRQTDKAVIVEAELPGVNEDDIDIEIGEDALTIKGEKKSSEEVKEKDYYRREFTYGSFSRTIALPVEVDSDKAEAALRQGTLRIELPKKEEAKPKTKKISLKKKDK